MDAQGESALIRVLGKMLPPISQEKADGFWLNATKKSHVSTAASFGVFAVRSPRSNEDRMRLGRIWQRLHLKGTTLGLAMQPMNQLIEISDREINLGSERYFGRKLRILLVIQHGRAYLFSV